MTTATGIAAALAEVERPKAHLLEPAAESPAHRLFRSPALRRFVPLPAALAGARLRGRIEARLPGTGAAARGWAAAALGAAGDEPEVGTLARRQLVHRAMISELMWHPRRLAAMPLSGFEELARAREGGRGVVLASVHLGPFLGMVHALAGRGVKVYVAGGHRLDEPPTNLSGILMNRWVEEAGCRWVHLGGAFPVLQALLERGEACYMLFDRPGGLVVELAGRPADISPGFAELAVRTGAAVVPCYTLHRGRRMSAHLLAPVLPAAEDDAAAVAVRVTAALRPAIRAHLEQLHPVTSRCWTSAVSAA